VLLALSVKENDMNCTDMNCTDMNCTDMNCTDMNCTDMNCTDITSVCGKYEMYRKFLSLSLKRRRIYLSRV
jgi:hypothetical protein